MPGHLNVSLPRRRPPRIGSADRGAIIGIDIGGTKCAVLRADGEGKVLRRVAFPTRPDRGPARALSRIAKTIEAMRQGDPDPPRFGISCGGPLDARRGVILSPPNLPGWDEIPIAQFLTDRFGGTATLMNDANAGALAEWRFGVARGCSDVVFFTFGTGLGAGLILGGRLHTGPDDLAGEAGHWRLARSGPSGHGKAGSFEGFCSGGGIQRVARAEAEQALRLRRRVGFCPTRGDLDAIDVGRVAAAARSGDPVARAIFRRCGRRLGEGLSLVIDLLNPEIIVLGGIYGRCVDLLAATARRVVEAETLPAAGRRCRIVPAQLGEEIGDYATIAAATYRAP